MSRGITTDSGTGWRDAACQFPRLRPIMRTRFDTTLDLVILLPVTGVAWLMARQIVMHLV